MTAIITNKFRVQNARAFMNSTDNYYMFIGRPQAWDDEIAPDTPLDNVNDEAAIWDDMMSLKKITANNMSYGIIKRLWSSGSFYDIWRHDYGAAGVNGVNISTGAAASPAVTNLAGANYFVVTGSGNTYICLNNNNNAASTVDPDTGTLEVTDYTVTCADGYIWRKISTTSGSDTVSFSTPQYHPVKTLTADPGSSHVYYTQWLMQEQAKLDAGMLTNILLTNGGTGYTNDAQTNYGGIVTIVGDGTGATATVNTDVDGVITSINITDRGTGYTWANVEFAPGDGGSNAAATAIIGPLAGLGADPVSDLCAFNTILNARFEYGESGDFTTNNDYRRIGLLVNPQVVASSALYTAATGEATTILTVATANITGTFAADQIIKVTGAGDQPHARVVDVSTDGSNTLIRIIRTREENSLASADAHTEFAVSDAIEVVTGGTASATAIDAITTPDIKIGSGYIAYIENRRQITRNPDQIESITTVFEW